MNYDFNMINFIMILCKFYDSIKTYKNMFMLEFLTLSSFIICIDLT